MSGFNDILSVFSDILPDPRAQQQEELGQNVGLFGAGLAGALGTAVTRHGRETRGQLTRAGVDMRTDDQKFRTAVNAIDPNAEDAEALYIEAARTYAPSKVPQLMEKIRQRRIQDEEAQFRRNAEQRQQDANARAEDLHASAKRMQELSNDLNSMQIEQIKDSQEAQAKAREFLKGSRYASRQGQDYLASIDALPPADLGRAVTTAMEHDEALSTNLDRALESVLGSDDALSEIVPQLGIDQKLQILAAERGAQRPDWQVHPSHNGSYLIDMNNVSNRIQFDSRIPETDKSERPTQDVVNGVWNYFADKGMEKSIERAFGIDKLDGEDFARIYQQHREVLIGAGRAGTVEEVTASIESAAALSEAEMDAQVEDISTWIMKNNTFDSGL